MERLGGIERPRLQKDIPAMRFLKDLIDCLLATGFRWSRTLLQLGEVELRLDFWLRLQPALRVA